MENELKEILDNEEMQYRKDISVSWKVHAHTMLKEAKADKEAFCTVLENMVGKIGSVLRSVNINERQKFFSYIFENYGDICKGDFDIFGVKETLGLSKDPLSFTSKICHIVSPQHYPLIWDSKVRKQLNIGDSRKKFKKELEQAKENTKGFSDEQIYGRESEIWAGLKGDND